MHKDKTASRSIDRRRLTAEPKSIINEMVKPLPVNLDMRQTCEFFGWHRNTTSRRVAEGELIAFRSRGGTGKLMIPRESIRRYLERTLIV